MLLSCLALFFLTGCQTTLTTKVQASGEKVTGSFVIVLENEAAEAIKADPSTDQQLLQTISDRTGTVVTRELSENQITYSSGIPLDKSLIDISGVAINQVEYSGENVKVTFQIAEPATLVDSLRNATKDDLDAAARFLVLQRTTLVCAEVTFAGGIESLVEKGPIIITRDGNSVRACASLDSLSRSDASLSVIGDPKRSILPFLIAGFAILLTFSYRRWLRR